MSPSRNGRGALATGGVAALLASTCCLGPLVLAALGVSGAWIGNLTALEPYRPLFLGAALVAEAGRPPAGRFFGFGPQMLRFGSSHAIAPDHG